MKLYEHAVKPLIDSAFAGAKVTCFAYGQTGSGKTYTMLGNPQQHIPGMYLLASHDIFKKLTKGDYERFSIWVSFYEIYCGKLYDLLNERTVLFAREDAKQNVNIVGLQ
jgi:kinesin family protein 2/24